MHVRLDKTAIAVVVVLATLFIPDGAAGFEGATDLEIDEPVVDRAGVLDGAEKRRLDATLRDHHEATGVQMAVLFIDTTGPLPIEDFSMAAAQNWEGGSAERDDGVLLTFAVDDREHRLELGYGIEPAISDGESRRILDEAIPALRGGDYAGAANQIITDVIDRTDHLDPGGEVTPASRPLGSSATTVIPVLFLLAVALGYFWRRRRGELYADDDFVIHDDPEDDTPLEERNYAAFPIDAVDVAYWVVPTGLVVTALYSGGYWKPLGMFFVALAVLSAVAARHLRTPLFVGGAAVGLFVFTLLPMEWGLESATVDQVVDFFIEIIVYIGIIIAAVIVSILRGGGRTFGRRRRSSGGSFSFGGGSSGSSGGFGGGGGGFGGGGSSSGW